MPASPEGARRWQLLVEPEGAPGWRQMATDRALLDHGEVVARGSFEELLESSPTFRAMVEAGSIEQSEPEPALSP